MGARDVVGLKPAMEIELTREIFEPLPFAAEKGGLLQALPTPIWPPAMVS